MLPAAGRAHRVGAARIRPRAGYSDPVRIVHISDCFAPRVGGIESQVRDLGINQAAAGHAVHVLTATALSAEAPSPTGNRYRTSVTEADGMRVHRLASPLTFGVPVHPRGRALITRALKILRPDVVHVHAGVVSPFAFDGARAARALGLPLAITWHCLLDGVTGPMSLGARVLGWSQAPFAPSAVSTVAAERVGQALGRDDVTVLPNGLDLDPWRAAAAGAEPSPAPGVLRVVATQRLAPRKRAVPLVRILGRVHQRVGRDQDGAPRVHLTIAGEGPAAGSVRAQIAAQGLDEVVSVLGRVPRELLPTLYRAQDVFFSATNLEAFGLAALEARAAGLAVVAAADTGIAEFVQHGVEGLLALNDRGLEEMLVRLATEQGLLATITEHNRHRPPALGWAQVLQQADALYARAQALSPRSAPADS